jgi:hypothetical protein
VPLFTLDDLAAYMQVPAVTEATGLLLIELTDDLITDAYGAPLPDPAPGRLRRIALEVAKRAYQNPNGYVSETLGDYSYTRGSRSNPKALDQSGVYLTDEERRAIGNAAGRATIRTVQLVSPMSYSDWP